MISYCSSKYNLNFEYNNVTVFFNTFSKEFIKCKNEDSDAILQILSSPENNQDSDIFEILLKKGFIILSSQNEMEVLKKQCFDLVNNSMLHLTMMPTYTCNFACTYCFQHHMNHAIIDNDTMNNIIAFVRNNISKYTCLYVEWFGGEPLIVKDTILHMHKNFREITHENHVPYVARITTNGYELDYDTFSELFSNHCFVFYISIDGVKEMHDKQRPHKNGKGSYDVIINNLIEIRNRAKSKNFRIEIRVNNSADTLKSLDKFISTFKELFGDDGRFVLALDKVNHWSDRTDNMQDELIERKDMEEYGQNAHLNKVKLSSFTGSSLDTQICQGAKRNAYSIFYDGTIIKCQMALEDGDFKGINQIGAITTGGELSIDKEKESLWVKDDFPASCEECIALPLCLGKKCVFAVAIKKTPCENIQQRLIEQIKLEEASNINRIEEIRIGDLIC